MAWLVDHPSRRLLLADAIRQLVFRNAAPGVLTRLAQSLVEPLAAAVTTVLTRRCSPGDARCACLSRSACPQSLNAGFRLRRTPVEIVDCVDKTATDYLESNGGSVKAPDQAGSYFRHPSNVQMVQLQDGRWAVSFTTDDWSETC